MLTKMAKVGPRPEPRAGRMLQISHESGRKDSMTASRRQHWQEPGIGTRSPGTPRWDMRVLTIRLNAHSQLCNSCFSKLLRHRERCKGIATLPPSPVSQRHISYPPEEEFTLPETGMTIFSSHRRVGLNRLIIIEFLAATDIKYIPVDFTSWPLS